MLVSLWVQSFCLVKKQILLHPAVKEKLVDVLVQHTVQLVKIAGIASTVITEALVEFVLEEIEGQLHGLTHLNGLPILQLQEVPRQEQEIILQIIFGAITQLQNLIYTAYQMTGFLNII